MEKVGKILLQENTIIKNRITDNRMIASFSDNDYDFQKKIDPIAV